MYDTEIDFILYPAFPLVYSERQVQQERLAAVESPAWSHSGPLYRANKTIQGIYQPRDFVKAVEEAREAADIRSITAVYITRDRGIIGRYMYRNHKYSDATAIWEGHGAIETCDVMSIFDGENNYTWADGDDIPEKYLAVEEVCRCGSTWRIPVIDGEAVRYICPRCGAATESATAVSLEPVTSRGLGIAYPIGGAHGDD